MSTPVPSRTEPRRRFRPRRRPALAVASAAALCAALGAAPPAAAADDDDYSYKVGSAGNERWMESIADDTSLADLSIPGTHNTMARMVTPFAECQDSELGDQLKGGVRALDIRARHFEDGFTMHHAQVYLKSNFDDVLSTTDEFLDANPSETVLMRIKPEHTEEGNSRSFTDTLDDYIAGDNGDRIWSPPDDASGSDLPDLGDVRGKIVILQDFDGEGEVYGPEWGGDGLNIQDDYEVKSADAIEGKWDKVREHFEAADSGSGDQLFVNFTSGAGGSGLNELMEPETIASGQFIPLPGHEYKSHTGVNEYARDWLGDNEVARTGVVFTDYPGPSLVENILAHNPG